MSHAHTIITDRVRERVRRDGVGVGLDHERATGYVREEVRRYSELALGGSRPLLEDEARAEREIVAALTGFGALQPLLDDPDIEELWINSPEAVLANPYFSKSCVPCSEATPTPPSTRPGAVEFGPAAGLQPCVQCTLHGQGQVAGSRSVTSLPSCQTRCVRLTGFGGV